MNDLEFMELSKRSRGDGQQLFAIANTIHTIGLVGVAVLGVVGLIGGMALIFKGDGLFIAGMFTLAITAFICWLTYLAIALSTSLARVFVHSMFCMLSTCETLRTNAREQSVNRDSP